MTASITVDGNAGLPNWFVPYPTVMDDAYGADRAWWQLMLGSNRGDKATFCIYVFRWGPPYTSCEQIALPIPIYHGHFRIAEGLLWLIGMGERGKVYQSVPGFVPCPGQENAAPAQKLLDADEAPALLVPTDPEEYATRPIVYPKLKEHMWRRRYHLGGMV